MRKYFFTMGLLKNARSSKFCNNEEKNGGAMQ